MKLCGKCGNQIEDSVVNCPYCEKNNTGVSVNDNVSDNTIISEQTTEKVINVAEKVANGVRIIKLIPVIIIGFITLIMGVVFLVVGKSNEAKYKGEVTATFVELTNCDEYDSEEGYCDAKYTYTVDGMSYDVFDSFVTDYYEPTLTVHYNLEDPSDYTLSDTGSPTSNIIMIVFGAVFALVGIIGIKNKNIRVK
jgi:hypothetical protein